MTPSEIHLCEDLLLEAQKSANKLAQPGNDAKARLTHARAVNELVSAYVKLTWHK